LVSGIVAGLTQILIGPTSRIPAIGASGAIAGVLGAYLMLFPGSRVTTLVPVFFLPWFIEIPAIIFLGFWFILQFFNGLLALEVTTALGGIAYLGWSPCPSSAVAGRGRIIRLEFAGRLNL
jgi:membrane associated rhomboid family serine protease